jgi:hypothetical protein
MRFTTYLPLFGLLLISCSDAKGNATGGDPRFDAALPPLPIIDASASDAGCASHGATWSDLYCDFFGAGPPGPGCSGTAGQCHGATGDPGAAASLFICGKTKDDCFKGITDKTASLVDTGNPPGSGLVTVLRHQQNGVTAGSMPFEPKTYVFSPDAIKRIEDWMSAGAPNN